MATNCWPKAPKGGAGVVGVLGPVESPPPPGVVKWGARNETVMEAEASTLGDNRIGWMPNCEDVAPPQPAPVCTTTCCAFCAFQNTAPPPPPRRLWRHVLGMLGVMRILRGVSVFYALCECYTILKPYVEHHWVQKRTSGHKRPSGRQRNMHHYMSMMALEQGLLGLEAEKPRTLMTLGKERQTVLCAKWFALFVPLRVG